MKLRIPSTAQLSFPLASAIVALLAAPSASGAVYYWDDNAAGANFGTAGASLGTWAAPTTGTVAGWSLSATGANAFAGFTTTTSDTVNFGNGATGLATGTITVSGTVNTGNMTFAAGSGSITLSGGVINLGGSRTITSNYTAGVNVTRAIASEIVLSGATTVTIGEIGTGGGTRQLTLGKLSGTGGTTFEYAGGNNGTGLILLNGASTYTGTTLISTTLTNANTEVRLGVANALPTTTVLTIGGAAGTGTAPGRRTDLNLNGNDQTLAGLATSGGGTLRTQSVFSSTAAILTVNDSGTRTFAGLIGNGGTNISVTKQGAGNWTLSGANTYIGQTKVEGGTITVSNATALGTTAGNTVVSSGGRIFTGTASISIAEAFNITGAGPSGTTGAINIGGSATGVAFTGAITLAGNTTIQGDGGTSTTFSGGIDTAGNVLTFKESGTITVNTAAISGLGGSIVKNTGGQLNLNFANSYTGNTTVNAGILSLGVSAAAGVGGTINLGDTTGSTNATLTLTGASTNVANALTVRTGSSGIKTISNASAASTTYSGNIAANDNLAVLGAMTGSTTFTISGTANTIAAGKTVSFSNTSASSGNFSDNALWSGDGATSYTSTSTTSSIVMTGAKTYTGGSTVGSFTGGAAVVATSSVGTGAGVTSGAFGTGTLTVGNGSRWRATTSADITVGNTLTLDGNLVAITVASEKSLIFSGPATLTGTRTFDVSIGNTVAGKSLTFSGAIGESGGSHGITKTGTGNMVLSGDNSYAGATLISAGTLTLSGASDINSSSGITVNGSTAKFLQTSSVASTPGITLTQGTLTGNGTVGNVNVGAGTGGIITNNNGVAGAALTIGNLTFNGAANLNLFSNSFLSTLDVTGTLTTASPAATLTVNNVGGWADGAYTILTFGGGSIAGSGDNFTKVVNNLVTRQSTTWNTTSSAITLTIAGDNPVWSGANGGTWTTEATDSPTSGTPNWALKDGHTATDFWAGDKAEFNDTYDIGGGPVAPTTTAVDISTANVSPASTTFNNSTLNYTLGSTGGFGIATGTLTKNGSGSLTINNANTYTGTTTLNGGILRATTSAAALGAGSLTLAGGELQLANDTGLSFGRNTTVTGNAQITSDTLTAVAGVTHTLGTLSIGGQTLTIAKGSLATGTTAGVTFGATTLTGAPTFSIGTDSTLALAAVTNAGNTITLTGAGNFSQTGTLSGVGGLNLDSGFSGTATLSGTGTNYSGATTISGGRFVLSSSTAFASAVTVNAGGTLQYSPTGVGNQAGVGAISLLGTLTYAPASNFYQVLGTAAGNKIVTVSGGASVINISPGGAFAASTGGLYLDGGLQGSSNLTVNATTDGFGLVLRNASSTYSGTMIVNGTASTTPGTGSGLAIGFLVTNATMPSADLTINGTLELGNSTSGMGWAGGTTTGLTFGMDALNGTGVIVGNMQTAASTRTISVGNNGGSGNFSGVIANGVNNTLSFTKAGSGTQTLSGLSATAADNYSGTTTIGEGTLAFTTTNPSFTGGLTFGASAGNTTTGALDLSAASATFGGALVVRTNTATANTIDIGVGRSLNLGNGMTVGYSSAANTVTKLNVTGDGALNITAGNFQLGGSVADGFGNAATLDMAGLATFSYNVSGGTFRVGDLTNASSGGTGSSTLILADTSTITALAFTMNSPTAAAHTVRLGSGVNTINANTINVGASSNRSPGTMNFNEATGSLTVRATDTTGRAAMTVAYGSATTAVVNTSSIDLTGAGHSADLLLSTLQIAGRTGNGAASTGTFSFGNGTLDATGVTVGVRAGTSGSTGAVNGTLNLGGGNVDIGASGLSVGLNTSSLAANTLNATVNISGSGTVDIGNTAGLSVTLGSSTNAGAGATTASLNLTGGTTTLTGDIRKGTATGSVTSTLTISGGSLDMGGFNIGTSSTDLITLVAESGTLKNVASINSTGGLTKTTAGTLLVSGTNGYTGGTTLTLGNIQIDSGSSLGSVNGTLTVTAGTLDVNGNDLGVGNFTGAGGTIVNNSIGTNKTLTIGNNNGTGGDYAGVIADNSGTGGTLALTKTGTGTLTLSNANSYSGGTNINAGTLQIGHANALGTTGTIAFGGGALKYGTGITTDLSSRFSTAASQAYKIDTNGSDVTVATNLASSAGTLDKSGAGKLELTGTHSYTGATTVTGGVLAVNGTLASISTNVSGTGSTLKGNGSIAGSVTIGSGGTLASGNSIESLAMTSLAFQALSTFEYELDKDAAANVAGDLTVVNGTLDLTGVVTLNLLESGTGAWELGNPLGDALTGSPNADKLTLIGYTGLWNGGLFTYNGNLVQDDSAIMLNGQQWWFNYNDTSAGTNYTGDLLGGSSFVTMTVPEPRAALLGGLGMLALLRRRRA